MRIVWSGIGVTDGRGHVGGTVASRNKNGAYLKKRTKPANPNTTAQQVVRAGFGYNSRQWKTLNDDERASFTTQAPNYPYKNKVGIVSNYTGFQLFSKVSNQLRSIGVPFITTMVAPVQVNGIQTIAFTTLDPANVKVSVKAIENVTSVPADCSLIIQGTRQLTAGVMDPKKSLFRNIGVLDAGTTMTNIDLTGAYTATFGAPIAGSKIYIQAFLVSKLTGQIGKALYVGSIA
jgi:hypothetical protein